MIRIRALNGDESSNDSFSDDPASAFRRPTKEIQEEEALDLYNRSLHLISESNSAEAAESLEKLLNLPYLNEATSKKDTPTQFQLKLGCLKNLGSIYFSLNPDAEAAARVYLQATKLEPTNINLWYRLGLVSMKIVDYELAYTSFLHGLQCNSSHWGCLENIITLAYVLNDSENCLKYCSSGLSKDSKFIRGLVFRDHIFELQPYLRESFKSVTPDWDILNTQQEYEDTWKEKYLNEARDLITSQRDLNKRLREEEAAERSKVITCQHHLRAYSFSNLVRVVLLFYEDIRALGTFLRPIDLMGQADTLSGESKESSFLPIEEDTRKTTEENSESSNPTDEKDGTSNNANGPEAVQENPSGVEENGDGLMEEVNGVDSGEKDNEEGSLSKGKKAKRDVKWWQLEGKRRSQRVRENLIPQNNVPAKKDGGFAERLKTIVSFSIICGILDGEDVVEETKAETSSKTDKPEYFGSEDEKFAVKKFIWDYGKSNVTDVVIHLIRTLANLNHEKWPAELASEYLELFVLYRIHVPPPDPYGMDDYVQECQKTDAFITLTMLELLVDGISRSTIDRVAGKEKFMKELFQVRQVCTTNPDKNLLIRLHWTLSKFYLSAATLDESYYNNAFYYLTEVDTDLTTQFNPDDIISTPALTDSSISHDELQKKFNLVQRMENVTRINEMYDSEQYKELVEVLTLCLKSQEPGTFDTMNKFYLADSLFHTKNYIGCINECLDIISWNGKVPPTESIVISAVSLLEKACKVPSVELLNRHIKKIVNAMMTLLVSSDQKPFGMVPPTLLTIPWCILYHLLHQMEAQNPALYLDQDATPNSILLLQFAHQFLSRDGNCSLNNGKLLNFTLEALLPLISCEEYSEFEALTHCIEQAICCLYSHPSKISKVRYLADHGCTGVPLDWTTCQQLYQYYKPTSLPEFDTYDAINAETEGLFLRILELVPSEAKPMEAYTELKQFLCGETDKISHTGATEFPATLNDIYYLLGDYYFKSKDWTKALESYAWDLAISPYRFDSWAAISLAKGEMINSQLNSCDKFNSKDIISCANVVLTCFRKALDLEPKNSKLRIEFGSFVYSMHSFCSRLLTTGVEAQLSLETFKFVDSKKEEFLSAAAKCFEPLVHSDDDGTDSCQKDDLWIHHYMLGKVMEKLEPSAPEKFLDQYELAGKLLHEHGAMYPAKINYYSPQEFSIEALEIYYRIHASIVTYIEKYEHSEEKETMLQGYVDRAAASPFMTVKLKRLEQAAEAKRKKPTDKDLTELKLLLETMIDSVVSQVELDKLNRVSSSSTSSSSPSSDDSSDSSSDDSVIIEEPAKPVSFGLSTFCEKLKEKELREGKLAEEAAAAAKAAAEKAEEEKLNQEKLKLQTLNAHNPVVEENCHFKDVNSGRILSQCLKAMQECISRFPAHHKSYYRISHIYFTFCKSHLRISKEWLLRTGSEKKKISGLFADRKSTNFFNGVWRNPVEDIDRPGSFPYHMAKTVQLLLQVLSELKDHEMLAEIGIQLAKIPDSDKKCLYDSEREQFSQQAFTNAVAAAKSLLTDSGKSQQDVAMSIFASYVKLQKVGIKDNPMASVLLECYKLCIRSKGLEPEDVNVDNAFKYYQHVAWVTKIAESGKGFKPKGNSMFPNTSVPNLQPISTLLQQRSSGHNQSSNILKHRKAHVPAHRKQYSSLNAAKNGLSVSGPNSVSRPSSSGFVETFASGRAKVNETLSVPFRGKPTIQSFNQKEVDARTQEIANYFQMLAKSVSHATSSFTSSSTTSLSNSKSGNPTSKGNRNPASASNNEFILPDLNIDGKSLTQMVELQARTSMGKFYELLTQNASRIPPSSGYSIRDEDRPDPLSYTPSVKPRSSNSKPGNGSSTGSRNPASSPNNEFILPDLDVDANSVNQKEVNDRTSITKFYERLNHSASSTQPSVLSVRDQDRQDPLSHTPSNKPRSSNSKSGNSSSMGSRNPASSANNEFILPDLDLDAITRNILGSQSVVSSVPLSERKSSGQPSQSQQRKSRGPKFPPPDEMTLEKTNKTSAEQNKMLEEYLAKLGKSGLPNSSTGQLDKKTDAKNSTANSHRSKTKNAQPENKSNDRSLLANQKNGKDTSFESSTTPKSGSKSMSREDYMAEWLKLDPFVMPTDDIIENEPLKSSKPVPVSRPNSQTRAMPKLKRRPSVGTRDYGNLYEQLVPPKKSGNILEVPKPNNVKLPQVAQMANFSHSLMNSVTPSGSKSHSGSRKDIPALFKPAVSTASEDSMYNKPPHLNLVSVPTLKPQPLAKKRVRKPSPSLLKTREPTTPPPTSMPAHHRIQLNTSPFKASSSIFVSPGLSTDLYFGQEIQVSRVERSSTPPAAHSANRTSPYSSSNGGPEIIDLTTNKSPDVKSATMKHPETNDKERLAQRGTKRGATSKIKANGGLSFPMNPGTMDPDWSSAYSSSLPPKKKPMMRPAPVVICRPVTPKPNLEPEIITLE